ncbi:epoxyqueuosine reductase QueH [Scatolibacter rhodanostii]|uniref:epoxyqueuosine reductase QueH n=1 Tax=Scatolibacter rhodanostii TaxID=2014781 RepID=UPI000C070DAC|nr:epoxyqueuosine reductase QueH [Scatolibacter rhodanostii]
MSNIKRNYAKEMDALIQKFDADTKPKLLLHVCCGPCSSAVLESIASHFAIYALFYNPNIAPYDEFMKRKKEFVRLVGEMNLSESVNIISCEYENEKFEELAKGLETLREGGERCHKCYELRMREAAQKAKELGCDYFTTTLSISPMKNSAVLNEIGERLGEEFGIAHLPSDFKKKEGYKRSIQLSRDYNLYRQDYCGCIYSKAQREAECQRTE